jgi:CheY-like chemotaxis protein
MARNDHPNPLRIAIFNDGHDTIALLSEWFSSQGHAIVTACLQDMRRPDSGAGEFIRQNAADIVVFDVGLPYQANWDFAEVLQLLPGAKNVPFVFTSANTIELDKIVGKTDAYLLTGTPANLEGLMVLVNAAAGRSTEP